MYSRESNPYGQQAYSSQSNYAQSLGPGYPGSSAGATEGSTQPSRSSRHSLMLGTPQEADTSAYRAHNHHLSTGPHYGGQYSSVYGSVAQQIPPIGGKGSVPSALESHTGFGSDSPKFTARDYVTSSNHGFGHKGEHLYSDPVPDYSTLDRRKYGEQYGEQRSAHVGRDLPSEQASRYPDSTSFGHKHQVELYERMDQASMIRQEQALKSQGLQSASLEGGPRQAEYLAARSAAVRHTPQDPISYGGRIDSDHRSLSALSGSLFTGQHAPSILGAAPQRSVDDVMYAHSSTNPGYGVSLPPGRDYGIGKGLHATPVESDYPSTRAGHSRLDDYKDDRAVYSRELERREKDQDYLREREKERDRVKERDRMKERERQRERDRERDREREREREKERERQRQRERDRERALERREKERDHERKRGAEIKHEQTPPRISRDRRGPSLTKDSKSLRRESPRPEALHRRHSPVKRREYFCKVYSSSLAEVERDYLSLDRRYPRLFISPECSKVLVNWPKGNLKLSLHTPVSFEHDFVEEGAITAQEQLSSKRSAGELEKSEHRMTIWNAKILLMSGLSKSALEELSSDRNYDDRIPHMCNMLRFAVLKQDNSLMAIGGQWDSVDGEDPSVDESLIQTVLRHAKNLAHLDLKNCQHWNRFLEIHYERVGKDGLFSHKEVTVYFVPDLSECLPSLESWREQWLTKKKAIAERERQHALRKEKSGDKESQKDKEAERLTDAKRGPKSEKSFTSGQSLEGSKKENDGKLKENTADSEGSKNKIVASKGLETCAEGNNSANKDPGESAAVETDGSAKLVKKRVIKRIVKQKTTNNKDDLETPKLNDMVDGSKTGDGKSSIETASPQDESSSKPPVKTFIRKKIVKKAPVGQTPKEKAELNPLDVKTMKAAESSEDMGKDKTDSSSTSVVQGAVVKKTIKRKIIKRVPKRKTVSADANNVAGNVDSNKDDLKEEKSVQAEIEGKVVAEHNVDNVENVNMINPEQKVSPKTESKIDTKQEIKEEKRTEEVNIAGTKTESGVAKDKDSQNDDRPKLKVKEQSKEETQKKGQDGKILSKSKSTREVKEKRNEDPPRHPGLFLQTKGSKDTKLRSLSLSLDSLLDYSDKDIEDSTFELSLLAESLYEMLYYEMGCRLMNFLQKLRIKFVIKRSQQKRQREESSKKESVEKSMKRAKTDEPMNDANSTKTESHGKSDQDDEKPLVKEEATSLNIAKEATSLNNAEEATIQDEAANDESEMDEDPEEEDLEMPDSSLQQDLTKKENAEVKLTDADSKSEKVAGSCKDEGQATAIEAYEVKPILKSGSKEEESTKVEKSTGATRGEVNKEVLQAFRFFDRNRAGYIRVEDMRLIIHNLGKYLSHREVKELVQSALLESNTGRDDRILYNKLISMTNV